MMTPTEAHDTWKRDYQGKPGKFEGEGPEALYFWDAIMEGDGDFCERHSTDDFECTVFDPTDGERKAFQLSPRGLVHVWQSEQGFVYLREDSDFEPEP